MYLFILSPPRHGSTILYKLLWTSPNVSTLFGASTWAGEGQFVPAASRYFPKDRWDSGAKMNWPGIRAAWHRAWDMSKPILCEKTPSNICRAREMGEFFSKFAPVYFICLIRSPYSRRDAGRWIIGAKYQRENMQNLENVFNLKYEDMVGDLPGTIDRLLGFLPKLKQLDGGVTRVPGLDDSKRNLPIQNMVAKFTTEQIRRRDVALKSHRDLIEFFGYEFRNV